MNRDGMRIERVWGPLRGYQSQLVYLVTCLFIRHLQYVNKPGRFSNRSNRKHILHLAKLLKNCSNRKHILHLAKLLKNRSYRKHILHLAKLLKNRSNRKHILHLGKLLKNCSNRKLFLKEIGRF